MKKLLVLFALTAMMRTSDATIVTITCQNVPSHFLPVTAYAVVGDTIRWTWIAGGHIVGPINAGWIPDSAAMWNAPIDASHLSFDYVVTAAGQYDYVCHPATPHGENGYIIVTLTGISEENNTALQAIYPNPSNGIFFVDNKSASPISSITVFNTTGQIARLFNEIKSETVLSLDLSDLDKGIYFVAIRRDEQTSVQRIVVL
jgi:plastocyanin